MAPPLSLPFHTPLATPNYPPRTPGGTIEGTPVSRRSGYVRVPPDWDLVAERRVLGFVTQQTFRRPDGAFVRWNSRAHRKRGRAPTTGSTWWAPHALAWWIAVLFIIGSACFAIGPLPTYASGVGLTTDTATFFVVRCSSPAPRSCSTSR
jgi:hypothetical protein